MNEQVASPLSLAEEEFQSRYIPHLDARLQRSEVLGSITLENRSAALFYDKVDDKFTLVEKVANQEEAIVFDSVPRQQWGRNVLLFGHATSSGGFIAGGHGSLTGPLFYIKLTSGCHYRFEVDPTLPFLAPLFVEAPAKKPARAPRENNNRRNPRARPDALPHNANPERSTPRPTAHSDREENEDFSAEDLRRLRGEAPMGSKRRAY